MSTLNARDLTDAELRQVLGNNAGCNACGGNNRQRSNKTIDEEGETSSLVTLHEQMQERLSQFAEQNN